MGGGGIGLSGWPAGPISVFVGVAAQFRTASGDPYEYTVTVDADHVAAISECVVVPGRDPFDVIVADTAEIVRMGEASWLELTKTAGREPCCPVSVSN